MQPCKKNMVVFQNSYNETYQTGQTQQAVAVRQGGAELIQGGAGFLRVQVTGVGAGEWAAGTVTVATVQYVNGRGFVETSYKTIDANDRTVNSDFYTSDYVNYRITSTNITIYQNRQVPTYGTRTVWNTRWSKLSA